MRTLLVATSNPHKLSEMKDILANLPYKVISLSEIGMGIKMPEENGKTFRDNAYIKAKGVYNQIKDVYPNIWVLADDSGLSIDALNGAPGIYSARYKGFKTAEKRLKAVLNDLKDIAPSERTAYFTTVMCLITHFSDVCTEGIVRGYITTEPLGTGGFGYDPIFYYPPLRKTYAQMSAAEKNIVSHRALASEKMKVVLKAFMYV